MKLKKHQQSFNKEISKALVTGSLNDIKSTLIKYKSDSHKPSFNFDNYTYSIDCIFSQDDEELVNLLFDNYEVSLDTIMSSMHVAWWCKDLMQMKMLLKQIFVCENFDPKYNWSLAFILPDIFTKFYGDPTSEEMIELIRQNIKLDFPCKPAVIHSLVKAAKEACEMNDIDKFKLINEIFPVVNVQNGYYHLLPHVAISGNTQLFDYIVELQPKNTHWNYDITPDIIKINTTDIKLGKNYHTNTDYNNLISDTNYKYCTSTDFYKEIWQKYTCEQAWNITFLFACSLQRYDIIENMFKYKKPIHQLHDGIKIAEHFTDLKLLNMISNYQIK